MIPAISPPTDNLYKLIALFGLGILIVGVVNIATKSDEIIKTKIEIEYIEKQIVDTILHYSKVKEDVEINFINTSASEGVSELMDEISIYEELIHNKKLPKKVTNYVDTELDIIRVKLLANEKQEFLNKLLISLAILLMLVGFSLWYFKEQRWYDKKVKRDANKIAS